MSVCWLVCLCPSIVFICLQYELTTIKSASCLKEIHSLIEFVVVFLYSHHQVQDVNFMLQCSTAEVVDLSGLSLQRIRAEWLLPALGSTTLLRRVSRPSILQRLYYHKHSTSDSDISLCSDAASELLDDNGRMTEESTDSNIPISVTDHIVENGEPNGYSTPKNKNIRRVSRGPDLPTIRSPMTSMDAHGNIFPYHEDGPTISPKSFEESVFDSPSNSKSPNRHRRSSDGIYAKPVFEFSITGAKSIPFHSRCRLKHTLEHSDSIFPPITNDFCRRACSIRRPLPSRGNSRAPSPLSGILHDTMDGCRQYYIPQQDILPIHISNGQSRVRKLNLSCNGLSSLDSLDVDGPKVRTLQEKLRRLEVLELHQNNLESLPEQLFKVCD